MLKRLGLVFYCTLFSAAAFAGDYLFISAPYLKATKQVIAEADAQARVHFTDNALLVKYEAVSASLKEQVGAVERKRLQKKLAAEEVTDTKDKAFADTLNSFKDALNFMAQKAGQPLDQLLAGYNKWTRLETAVVQTGVDARLEAYQTRFGPESEPINIVELLVGEKFLPGTEAGPSPWEPIMRFSAVQVTTVGSGLTSSVQLGTNYYFVKGAPKWLETVGVSNHIGVAAALQYLEDPEVFQFKGRPSFGAVLHIDRKEIGAMWDPEEDKFRLTLGYAFQFVPFVF